MAQDFNHFKISRSHRDSFAEASELQPQVGDAFVSAEFLVLLDRCSRGGVGFECSPIILMWCWAVLIDVVGFRCMLRLMHYAEPN